VRYSIEVSRKGGEEARGLTSEGCWVMGLSSSYEIKGFFAHGERASERKRMDWVGG
jgi:hypothetical protein